MQITEHAQDRIVERRIDEWQLELVLEHGVWNSRGDRLTLGVRQLRKIIDDRRRTLRALENQRCSCAIRASKSYDGGTDE